MWNDTVSDVDLGIISRNFISSASFDSGSDFKVNTNNIFNLMVFFDNA